jgi:hypothetical protein
MPSPGSANGASKSSAAPMPPRAWCGCPGARVVDRPIAWLQRNRRLAKDFEATVESALAWILIASVKLLARRLQDLRAMPAIMRQTLRPEPWG